MVDRSRLPDPSAPFKEQARRLERFLHAGGIAIKHSHALEAVAQLHGFADFHLLAHSATAGVAVSEVWVVATYCGGLLPQLTVAEGATDGIGAFLMQVARIAAASPAEISVRAQAAGSHRGLYAVADGALLCSLTCPPRHAFAAGTVPFQPGASFADVGREITEAFWDRAGGWTEFEERVHDEGFWNTIQSRLEDRALRGATSPPRVEDPEIPVDRLETIIEAAHTLEPRLVSPRSESSRDPGGRHG